ncbi:MAG TPA: SBBP repeat-containing protein [Bryobacteraceae bacterium]|nr:SBBP repeat-containing protein [Bryobacteraceae bacterium]
MRSSNLLIAAFGLAIAGICYGAPASNDALKREVVQRYEIAPLAFSENRGQAPRGVDYVSSGLGHRILVRRSGVEIYTATGRSSESHRIAVQFDGASPTAKGEALEATAARSGFLLNGLLVEGLANYARLRYRNVWPNTDIVYYGTGRDLEYDIVLRPGADPSNIHLSFSGVRSLRTDADGNLVLTTSGQEILQHKPRIYQQVGDRKVEIAGQYHLLPNHRVTFELANYDRARELVIDPVLGYKLPSLDPTILFATSVAADSAGNAYLTGQTTAINHGYTDLFVIKINPQGTALGTFEAGGVGGNTAGDAITLDGSGNIYVAGQTKATGLSTCSSCGFQSALANAQGAAWDGFLLAFNSTFPQTSSVTYITYIGGGADDIATAVAATGPNAVYVAGTTSSHDFPTSSVSGGYQAQTNTTFLVKVDTTQVQGAGSKLWARYVGGSGTDSALGLAADASGNTYLVGTSSSNSSSFRPYSSTGFNASKSSTSVDGFLDKIDPTGANSLYFTYFTNGPATGVAAVGSTAYVAGITSGSLGNITASAAQPSYGGGTSDAFLFRVDTAQTGAASLIYSTYLGGSGIDQAYGVAADASGNASIVGMADGNFPVKGQLQSYGGGTSDGFYTVINTGASGAASLVMSTWLGDSTADFATGVALGGSNQAFIAAYSNAGKSQAYMIGTSAVSSAGLAFFPVTPCRVVDTRLPAGSLGGPTMQGGSTRTFPVLSSPCGIPSTAQSYSFNVTAVPPGPMTYLSIWPAGSAQPGVSTLNATDGTVVANAAIVPAGASGGVSVFVSDASNVIIDINGYFAPPSSQGLAFYPVTPCRVADTRGNGKTGAFGTPSMGANATRNFPITSSSCNIPGSAQAFSLNMTAVPPGALTYLSTWPTGQPQPVVSTLNSFNGRVVANAAIVPAGNNGSISVFTSDPTDVIIDIDGYFAPAGGPGALLFHAVSPCRVADTRGGAGPLGGPSIQGNASRDFPAASACGLPASAGAYSLNVTAVPPGQLIYLTMWSTGQPQPGVSTLNSFNGKVVANAAFVPVGANGSISVFVSNTSDVIVDTNGYFAP